MIHYSFTTIVPTLLDNILGIHVALNSLNPLLLQPLFDLGYNLVINPCVSRTSFKLYVLMQEDKITAYTSRQPKRHEEHYPTQDLE
jgi:hypothetical protein